MVNFQPHGASRNRKREAKNAKRPLYIAFVLDTSSSMYDYVSVNTPEGNAKQVRKIEELNQGLGFALNSLRRFEAQNLFYKVYYQIIELNSYGKALFPDFVPLSLQSEKICFEANGVTCLENSLATLNKMLDPKHLPGCNRAVNVILMSDGYPTDVEGYVQDEAVYMKTIASFKKFLETSGLKPNVDLYSIGVGEDACRKMLTAFADEGKYYEVEDLESLADKLDFVTRKSLVRLTSRRVQISGEGVIGNAAPGGANSISRMQQSTDGDTQSGASDDAITAREVDISKCLGAACLSCVDACVHSAITYENGLVLIAPERCIGCGMCESSCPADAIHRIEDTGCDGLI